MKSLHQCLVQGEQGRQDPPEIAHPLIPLSDLCLDPLLCLTVLSTNTAP